MARYTKKELEDIRTSVQKEFPPAPTVAELTAEVERLRFAITSMACTCGHYQAEGGSMNGLAEAIIRQANYALGQEDLSDD